MKVDILLFGSKGQLGSIIKNHFKDKYKLISLHKRSIRYEGNFLNEKSLIDSIRKIKPKIIINAAAFTAVDDAENNKKITKIINETIPGKIAVETKKLNALLIHFSTDYVYSGIGKKPWTEKNKMIPKNYYGLSKSKGDKSIINSGCNFIILRSSWIYSSNGKNFLNTMINLAKNKKSIHVINDQVGTPTSAFLLVKATDEIIKDYFNNKESSKFLNNTFHLAPKGFVSWHGFSLEILNYLEKHNIKTKLKKENVISVNSKQYRQKARRPLNSRLNTNKAKKMFDLKFLPWQEELHQILNLKLENNIL